MAFINKLNYLKGSIPMLHQWVGGFLFVCVVAVVVCSICPPSSILKEMLLTNSFGQYSVSGIA